MPLRSARLIAARTISINIPDTWAGSVALACTGVVFVAGGQTAQFGARAGPAMVAGPYAARRGAGALLLVVVDPGSGGLDHVSKTYGLHVA